MNVSNIRVDKQFIDDVINDVRMPFKIEKGSMKRMNKLSSSSDGSQRKLLRQLPITCQVRAPLAWWLQFDTYKVGVDCYSESVMHTILNRSLTLDDFLLNDQYTVLSDVVLDIISRVNQVKCDYKANILSKSQTKMIIKSMLPGCLLYKRRVTFNYQVLRKMYNQRKFHELTWWQDFLNSFHHIPYFNQFILNVKHKDKQCMTEGYYIILNKSDQYKYDVNVVDDDGNCILKYIITGHLCVNGLVWRVYRDVSLDGKQFALLHECINLETAYNTLKQSVQGALKILKKYFSDVIKPNII